MSGRIKILKNGVPVSSSNKPPIPYAYDVPSSYDQSCGTYGLDAFQLPNPSCPSTFICNADQGSQSLAAFSDCMNANNCFMMDGMTTGVKASSETVLFVHQMVPHHQNAVNMAKSTLHTNVLSCGDITNEQNPDCLLKALLYDVVNTQNHQIQQMRNYLKAYNYPATDNCLVVVDTISIQPNQGNSSTTSGTTTTSDSSATDVTSSSTTQDASDTGAVSSITVSESPSSGVMAPATNAYYSVVVVVVAAVAVLL
jgi:Domain of unknown function (DUF305)